MQLTDWLRVVFLGILEGVTEWLPISSTGHLVLVNRIWPGHETVFTRDFTSMFDILIQLGAILAVVTLFFHKLNPFSGYKTEEQKKNTWTLWFKVVAAAIPAGFTGLFLDDLMDKYLYNWPVIASMLILYGVVFIVLEKRFRNRDASIMRFSQLNYKTAFLIGVFQILSLIPGTSRSGITIIGALVLGCSRYIATEFTFYLAIPMMVAASGLKLFKYLFIKKMELSGTQWMVLFVAMAVAYVVSLFIIRFLTKYVKRHDFSVFGWYRIALGVLVILLFAFVL